MRRVMRGGGFPGARADEARARIETFEHSAETLAVQSRARADEARARIETWGPRISYRIWLAPALMKRGRGLKRSTYGVCCAHPVKARPSNRVQFQQEEKTNGPEIR